MVSAQPAASIGRRPDWAEAERALSPDGESTPASTTCPGPTSEARIRCWLSARFARDGAARREALYLFDNHRVVVGVERERMMDGRFRGMLHLVPEPPIGRHRRHLGWVRAAHDAFSRVFASVASHARRPVRYRHDGVVYRFFRSVGRTTPSAYATQWQVAYNVSGSLHRSEARVRETLFHEIFHLNDQPDDWAAGHLADVHSSIVARCGTERSCLAPYSPTGTKVRGGTYYAFQPNNGNAVVEYGAEIGARWFEEHYELLQRGRLRRPSWKCAAPENAEAYRRVVDEFFGGVDLSPACAAPRPRAGIVHAGSGRVVETP